jgi:hypothetical protein
LFLKCEEGQQHCHWERKCNKKFFEGRTNFSA